MYGCYTRSYNRLPTTETGLKNKTDGIHSLAQPVSIFQETVAIAIF